MGERLLCKQEVIGSIPFTSTSDGGGDARGRCRRTAGRDAAAVEVAGARHQSPSGGCCVAPVAFPKGNAAGVSADL